MTDLDRSDSDRPDSDRPDGDRPDGERRPGRPPRPHLVSVLGSGTASAPPDLVRVRLAASAMRPTLAAALDASEQAAAGVRAALAERGVPAADAVTVNLSINAEQIWTEQHGSRITGYRSDHGLLVTLREIAGIGRVLGSALGAGGDDLRLDGVEFVVEDDADLRRRARAAAWADALAKATQLAELAGHALGPVLRISEEQGFGAVRAQALSMPFAAAAAKDVAVEPGSVDVQVTISVQWALA